MIPFPPYVDLRPLGRCNLDCPFCFGPRHDVPSMERDTALDIAALLRDAGVRGVVLSGGEPTLLPWLPELACTLAGFADVVLSSNGLAARALRRTLPHLSWLALPIDSADPAENRAMRTGNPAHQTRVIERMHEVRRDFPGVQIKLGTVITRVNPGAVRVLDLLDDASLPDVWKLYELSATSYGADNYDRLSVDSDIFEDTVRRCEKAAAERGVPVTAYRNSTRSGTYVFIDPDCTAVVIRDGEEHRIGHVLHEPDRVAAALRQHLEPARNTVNFEGTYRAG